jgi:hypothetical protein
MPARIATTPVEQRALIQQTRMFVTTHRRLSHRQHWANTALDILEGLANALEGRLDAEKAPED